MRNLRITASLAVAALLTGAAVACAPDRAPLAPSVGMHAANVVAPGSDSVSSLSTKPTSWSASGLRRETPLAADITVEKVIGPRGGRLEIRAAGFSLDVPAGAVAQPTTFRVTALAGDMLAYEFGPSGAEFPVALRGTQELRGTLAHRLPRGATLTLGYFRTPSDVDAATGTAMVAQELSAVVDGSGHRLDFRIPHFSGWIILWRGDGGADSTQTP